MKKIISIAGTVGSGKSSICDLISKKLNYKCYLMGDVMRNLASERKMNIVEFNEYMKNDPQFDHLVDQKIVEICKNEENIVISSRTAWYFVPDSFKVYLHVDEDVAAQRILEDSIRINEKYHSLEEAKLNVIKRNTDEIGRYMKIYDIDVTKVDNYDLELNTSNMTLDEVLSVIIDKYMMYLGE